MEEYCVASCQKLAGHREVAASGRRKIPRSFEEPAVDFLTRRRRVINGGGCRFFEGKLQIRGNAFMELLANRLPASLGRRGAIIYLGRRRRAGICLGGRRGAGIYLGGLGRQ